MSDGNQSKKLPTSSFARTAITAQTLAKAGGKSLTFLAKKPFLNAEAKQQQKQDTDAEIAQEIFNGLSKLRGTALKIAQMLSLETNILPAHLREQLSRSHYQVPPLNKALVRQVVEAAFGRRLEEVYASFELDAFAAASLGQVHRATLHDGTKVAVKVQYPGIKEAIATDIKLVKALFMPLAAKILPKAYVEQVVQEIAQRLEEETNYLHEAEQARIFIEQNTNAGIVIPRPFLDLTRRNILTTELLVGKHLHDWLKSGPSQAQIDRAAQLMTDFQITCLLANDRVHADPNPGNYLFLDDGRVGVIDFGCVKIFDDKRSHDAIKFAMRAMMNGRRDLMADAYRGLGVNLNHPNIDAILNDYLLPFADNVALLGREEAFDYKANPDFASNVGRNIMHATKQGHLLDGFTPDTVFLDRASYGLMRIFQIMGAKVSYRHPLYKLEA